jgi:hypothetical protein
LIPIAWWKTAEAVSAKSRFSLFCCFFDLRFDFGMAQTCHTSTPSKIPNFKLTHYLKFVFSTRLANSERTIAFSESDRML